MESHIAMKNDEQVLHATTRMNLTDVMIGKTTHKIQKQAKPSHGDRNQLWFLFQGY